MERWGGLLDDVAVMSMGCNRMRDPLVRTSESSRGGNSVS